MGANDPKRTFSLSGISLFLEVLAPFKFGGGSF